MLYNFAAEQNDLLILAMKVNKGACYKASRSTMAQRYAFLVLTLMLTAALGTKLPTYFYIAKPGPTRDLCRRLCDTQSAGSYPATILSAADNAAVRALFQGNSVIRGVLGGTRLVGNNQSYRWVAGPLQAESGGLGRVFFNGTTRSSGSCVPNMYCNFSPGEPNADPTHPEGPEASVEFTSNDGMWNDIPDGFPPLTGCVCQRPRTSTVSRTAQVSQSVSASWTSSATRPNSSTSSTESKTRTSSTTFTSSVATVAASCSLTLTHTTSASTSTETQSINITRISAALSSTESTTATSRSRVTASNGSYTNTRRLISCTRPLSAESSLTFSPYSMTSSASCGPPPLVMFFAASSVGGSLGGGSVSLMISVGDLLLGNAISFWMSAALQFVDAWSLASRQPPSGAGFGATLDITRIRNTSTMPAEVALRTSVGETVWRVSIRPSPTQGWMLTSTSRYVTQKLKVHVSFLCANGGEGDPFNYAVTINAAGDPLPFTPAYQIGTTFSQSMGQIASGTVIPTSLSTMRALARLASCGTTDSGADTSYGIVSVLVPILAPLQLPPNAEVMSLNMLMCLLVTTCVVTTAMVAYVFLCRSVPIADVMAHFHLPSLVAPSIMFAFPTVLGTAIAIFASSDDELMPSFVVGVLGLLFSGLFIVWITLSTSLIGPRRVVAIRVEVPPLTSFMTGDGHASTVVVRAARWCKASLQYVCMRTFSWKGIKGAGYGSGGEDGRDDARRRNVMWKHGYHILVQDVRFLMVPVAEAVCATVATVTTALVVVPGVGCQTAISVIAIFYAAQTLLFLWIRPYTSPMMQVFAAFTNVLTLLATIALAVDIFGLEQTYSMRFSVAFQLMILGVSMMKGIFDAIEFVEGSRRLWRWVITQHEARLAAGQSGVTLTVHYGDDDAVSDDDINIMMRSVTVEDPPRTPLRSLGGITSYASRYSARSSSVMSCSNSSISDLLSQRHRTASLQSCSTTSEVPQADETLAANYSFVGIAVDGDTIDRTLRERQRDTSVRPPRRAPTWSSSYTAFLVDEASEDLAEVAEARTPSAHTRSRSDSGDEL
jgi:hypothetical protein